MADLTASQIAQVSGPNRNTLNRLLRLLRQRMAAWCASQSPFSRVVEADDSHFGPQRVNGMTGRGAGRKNIIFGIFNRGGQVWCQVVPDVSMRSFHRVILKRVEPSSVINTDRWLSCNPLGDFGFAHVRVDHGRDAFVRGEVQINGIAAFRGCAKTRLARFRGIRPATFSLSLKECDTGNRGKTLARLLLKICRENPISTP